MSAESRNATTQPYLQPHLSVLSKDGKEFNVGRAGARSSSFVFVSLRRQHFLHGKQIIFSRETPALQRGDWMPLLRTAD